MAKSFVFTILTFAVAIAVATAAIGGEGVFTGIKGYSELTKRVDSVDAGLARSTARPVQRSGEKAKRVAGGASSLSEEHIQTILEQARKNGMDEENIKKMEEEIRKTANLPVMAKAESPDTVSKTAPGKPGFVPEPPKQKISAFDPAKPEANSAWAMDMANAMAAASFYRLVDDGFIKTAGQAVKACPHPLVLNNYGGMLLETRPADALFFFQEADAQQPDNPVFLTNIAAGYLETGDFASAERYATQAIRLDDEYGLAYQVMATVHLKNSNPQLAAEAMVKSARNCFDDNTRHLFISFLDGVRNLKPGKDEYPLSDEYIDLLYQVARSNVGMGMENPTVDTPAAQIKIKPFPSIASVKDLANAGEWLRGEIDKRVERVGKLAEEGKTVENRLSQAEMRAKQSDGLYPVDTSERQRYAYAVMRSRFHFKLKPVSLRFLEKQRELEVNLRREEKRLGDRYYQMGEAESKRKNGVDSDIVKRRGDAIKALGPRPRPGTKATNAAHDAKILKIEVEFKEMEIDNHRRSIEEQRECLREAVMPLDALSRDNITARLNLLQEEYNHYKQYAEEYWLRTGGILKYVTNQERLDLLNINREMTVFGHLDAFYLALYVLSQEAANALDRNDQWNNAVAQAINFDSQRIQVLERQIRELKDKDAKKRNAGKKVDEEKIDRQERDKTPFTGEETMEDVERVALERYPMVGELPTLGVDFGAFGVGSSYTFDGYNAGVGIYTPAGDISGSADVYTGEKTLYQTFSKRGGQVTAIETASQFDPMWFASKDVRDVGLKALGRQKGPIGNVANFLSGVDGSASANTRQGTYNTTDSSGRVTDQGKVFIRTSGAGVKYFGVSDTTTVTKSLVTGVANKSVTRKYQFLFVTIETKK